MPKIKNNMPLGLVQRCGLFLIHSRMLVLKEPQSCLVPFIRPRNFSGVLTQSTTTKSCKHLSSTSTLSTDSSLSKGIADTFQVLFNRKTINNNSSMGYFVIGVSGVTCGGKTTLTKLLLRKFPWAQVIHQDHYFYDDDYPQHIRVPEAENHVNYEICNALDMDKMYKDVQALLDAPPKFAVPSSPPANQVNGNVGDKAETPNFDDAFLQQIPDIDFDVSKYNNVPILIIEGFIMFASQNLFDKCDARFFCTLDKETCAQRRLTRSYFPPDTPNYFETIVWPEYQKHYDNFIHKRPGVTVFDGSTLMTDLWKASVQVIACRLEEKLKNDNLGKVTLVP